MIDSLHSLLSVLPFDLAKPLKVGVIKHDEPPIINQSGSSGMHTGSWGKENNSENQWSPLRNVLMAGGLGGGIGDTVMYPLDTIKTRQQGAPNVLKYQSMWEAAKTILKEEGVFRGVYSGYSPAVLGSIPSTMAFFGAYELTKRKLISDYGVPETVSYLAGGLVGDFASSFIYVPSEVLKTRLQVQGRYNNPYFHSGYNYKGLNDAIVTIIRTEGIGALFYGYKATLTRDLPFSALQFAFYEEFRMAAQNIFGIGNEINIAIELGTGALAGGLAGTLTTPLDVVKTRVQTQNPEIQVTMIESSKGTIRVLGEIYKAEGLRAMFSGVGPRLVWTSVQSSIMLMAYQGILKWLDQ